jgi:ribulose-phosphate 3-epimerase
MKHPPVLSVSILSADFACLREQVAQIEAAGGDWIHIDVMDGHFVPNITMGPFIVETFRRLTHLPLDVHLMIEQPERYLEAFAKAGANLIYVQAETVPHLHGTLQTIRKLGCQAGVVLNPGTPASVISAVLPLVDVVLVMSVNPGYSGQAFIPEVSEKIAEIRRMLDENNPAARVAVDGGISDATLGETARAGADFFIAASAVFHHPQGISAGVQALRASIPAE